MLDIFSRGQLPGDTPRHARAYQRADAGTFNDIYRAAVSLSSKCVNKKVETEAGWSSTGKSA